MRKPIITLLTDFGMKDHYVASMKGVILGINPQCTLIDITHKVNPHDIEEGAFLLAKTYSYFPKGTIHLAVVDPGVGGERKPILLVTQNYLFVGPDNGLFTLVAKKEGVKQVITLTNKKYFLPQISATFHGRDVFAPVAAHLSSGIPPSDFGEKLDHWVKLDLKEPVVREKKLFGEIVLIDLFGNLISNIDRARLTSFVKGHPFVIRIGEKAISNIKEGYWGGKKQEAIALFGSGGFLEISINEGNAQRVLKVKKGDPIQISTQFPAYRQAGKHKIQNRNP
jgi:S-adenosylmethionine hydrolase